MPEVRTSISIKVAGGPALVVNSVDNVEAYDVIEVTVPAGAADQVVQVQPAAADHLNLLLVQSDRYDAEGKLKYVASDGAAADSGAVDLRGPQLFGAGMAGLFGNDIKQLKFTSTLAEDAHVRVIVGRDATPP